MFGGQEERMGGEGEEGGPAQFVFGSGSGSMGGGGFNF